MSVRIARAGMLDTIQDLGRRGFAKWGVNMNGAMDRFAASVANALIGNDVNAPVLELHYPAAEIIIEESTLISITGADFSPRLNGKPTPLWRTIAVPSGAVLTFAKKESGARCYLAVSGGFRVAGWLGSASTNTKVGAGGFAGRSLKKGDHIPLGNSARSFNWPSEPSIFPWSVNFSGVYSSGDQIGFIKGRDWHTLDISSTAIFDIRFSVSSSSDRMALVLDHEPLHVRETEPMLSSGVAFGTVQLLPDGKLIVLMADGQTIGGYPQIGAVITAHLPRLAQLSANQSFSLYEVTVGDAEKMVFSLEQDIRKIQRDCRDKLQQIYAQR